MRFFARSTSLLVVLLILVYAGAVVGQSTNQNFPTPVTSSEISGTIKPRDVGDARLTSYFYQFDGDQGDLFINVVTRNFNGDLDVFAVNGLRPLTKIVLFADFGESETGRVIYLRKPEKMILRIQGRTPGDDAATFRIKFAGSFVASTQAEPSAEPSLPNVAAKNDSGIRVNSVGTIVEVIPKATPTPASVEATAAVEERREVEETDKAKVDQAPEVKTDASSAEVPEKKLEVVIVDTLPGKTETAPAATTPPRRRARSRSNVPTVIPPRTKEPETPPADTAASTPPASTRRGRTPPKAAVSREPDPLEKVNLIILCKDGTSIERPMSEILRFGVDKGVLTVITKTGSIGRYAILDVEKLTVQ